MITAREALAQNLRIVSPRIPKRKKVSKLEKRKVFAFLLHLGDFSDEEIARYLEVSPRTVRRYIESRIRKYPKLKKERFFIY